MPTKLQRLLMPANLVALELCTENQLMHNEELPLHFFIIKRAQKVASPKIKIIFIFNYNRIMVDL